MTDYFLNDLDDVFYEDSSELTVNLRDMLSNDRISRRKELDSTDNINRGILKKPSLPRSRSRSSSSSDWEDSSSDLSTTEDDSSMYSSTTSISTSTSSKPQQQQQQSVSFDTVEIREYQMMLDDSLSEPASLTIEWKPVGSDMTTVLEFECFRRRRRRHNTNNSGRIEPKDPLERASILLNAGYKLEELCFEHDDDEIKKEVLQKSSGGNLRLKSTNQNNNNNNNKITQTATRFHKSKHLYSKVKRAARKFIKGGRIVVAGRRTTTLSTSSRVA